MKRPELLAPAGNLEKLKIAINYGADAVYAAGKRFGLRAYADNFEMDELKEGIDYAHRRGKKVYVTLNIIPHNADLEGLDDYVRQLAAMGVYAIIVSDPGVLAIVRETAPRMEIHLSTQANNTNWRSARFWHEQGVKRIILARELSLDEIKEIRQRVPDTLELEAFVHGAMCISYSGRCLLSNYLAGRDANRGECAQSCRWKYYFMEEKRPGEYLPVMEDERGAYIFNSKDLMMIEYIPELMQSGISSFKIEGRMKTSFYVATVVKAYRQAIDGYLENPEGYVFDSRLIEEISKASNREFTTGFYFKKPGPEDHAYSSSRYVRKYEFVGLVLGYDYETKEAIVEQRNRFFVGEILEVFSPVEANRMLKVEKILDQEGNSLDLAPHPQQIIRIPTPFPLREYDILRKEIRES
ncbi:MAG: peptidase U32 family protein [Clostridia bacterium]|jgi:putative protease